MFAKRCVQRDDCHVIYRAPEWEVAGFQQPWGVGSGWVPETMGSGKWLGSCIGGKVPRWGQSCFETQAAGAK